MTAEAASAKDTKPKFDQLKARERIEKGRRSKWWLRKGTMKSGFNYADSRGKKIADSTSLERIKSLVIPPAWKHVRISPAASSRIQAVGMDTTGRVQYLYHPTFSERQQKKKFEKIERFGRTLPKLRKETNKHLRLPGFPREKVLALALRLINQLYIRMGAEKSAKHYKTYGLTTLQNRHLEIGRGGKLTFDFVGKSHIKHRKVLADERLAKTMKELKELGTSRKLFHYLDDEGKARPLKPSDINGYIKSLTGDEFSSKDFRTWGASLLAATTLSKIGVGESEAEIKKNMVKAVKYVADELGNTPSVCRSSYIHPLILKAYSENIVIAGNGLKHRTRQSQKGLEADERSLLKLLKTHGNGSR